MKLRTAAIVLPLLLCPARQGALTAEPAGAATPVFGADVSLVMVPVFVVDKGGKALPGLGVQDFQLFDDGKPVKIASFEYVDTTAPETQAEIRDVPAARRHFLLLFDLSFTTPNGLQRARSAARDFVLKQLADSDLVAVATFDVNRGIRLVANFSEDKGAMLAAIATLGAPAYARPGGDPLALAVGLEEEQAGQIHRSGDDFPLQSQSAMAAIVRRLRAAEDELYRSQALMLLESLQALGRNLRGLAGRKQILLFSAGFDAQVLVGTAGTFESRATNEAAIRGRITDVDSDARSGDSRLRIVTSDMGRTLSSGDCVVHAIDVTGLGTERNLSQQAETTVAVREVSGRESLNLVAAETGGRLFKDTNDLRSSLAEISEMTSRFYILGYQPDDLAGPGRFHKLKVKVDRSGSRVSNRNGFFERQPAASEPVLQRRFEAAQLVMSGVGTTNLRFSALCLPFPAAGDRQTLGVVLQVPKAELHWEQPFPLEVYGYAVAEDGSIKDHLAQLVRFDPASAEADHQVRGVAFYGALQLAPGKYTLKLLVQEPETGAAGVQFLDVDVPPADPQVGFLLPPVLVDEPKEWLVLNMGAGTNGRPDLPFALGNERFLPRTSFRVTPGTAERLVLIAYQPERPGDPSAGVEISSTAVDASGRHVAPGPMRIEKVYREAGRRTYVLGFTPESLAPGDYTLKVDVGEAGSSLQSYSLLRVAGAEAAHD